MPWKNSWNQCLGNDYSLKVDVSFPTEVSDCYERENGCVNTLRNSNGRCLFGLGSRV